MCAHALDLFEERLSKGFGQECDAIFSALSVVDEDLVAGKIDVFDPKARAFEEAEASTVKKGRHESGYAFHMAEDGARLVTAQDYWQVSGPRRAYEVGNPRHRGLEDSLVEKGDRAEGLLMGGRAGASLGDEVTKECLDFGRR